MVFVLVTFKTITDAFTQSACSTQWRSFWKHVNSESLQVNLLSEISSPPEIHKSIFFFEMNDKHPTGCYSI